MFAFTSGATLGFIACFCSLAATRLAASGSDISSPIMLFSPLTITAFLFMPKFAVVLGSITNAGLKSGSSAVNALKSCRSCWLGKTPLCLSSYSSCRRTNFCCCCSSSTPLCPARLFSVKNFCCSGVRSVGVS